MKEFTDKLIGRLEEEKEGAKRRNAFDSEVSYSCAIRIVNQLAEEYAECYKDCEQCEAYNKEEHYCPKWCNVIKNTVEEMMENETGVILMQLLESKRKCGEDSDCSECPFSQIEDRCILAELQNKGGNNGWIPCSERLPETFHNVLICTKEGGRAIGHRCPNQEPGRYYDLHSSAIDNVIAWCELPAPYQPEETVKT